jgi:predicted AlkP superfamily pyrophosphatase or phosphodiesterase
VTPAPLAELLPGAAHLLGVRGFATSGARLADVLGHALGEPRHIVVLLVDGLGAQQLAANAGSAPRLAAMAEVGPMAAPFPSTTCVSLTSLGTGLPPGMHGIVGTTFRLEDGSTLAPLSWGAEPNPIATQPEPTVLERAEAAGILVTSAAPAAHRASGLTRAALRGGDYPGADTLPARLSVAAAAISRARAEQRASLTYVYWPDLDKTGHVHGVDSPAYRAALARVDSLVAGLLDLTSQDVALLVTADHGLIDVADDRRVDLEARPALRRDVETILGEPRVRHVYTLPGRAESVRSVWAEELGGRADVRTREQVADLLGPVDDWYAERIGDVVAIARDDWALTSHRIDSMVSGLRGQHGGLTDAEVLIPLRAAGGTLGRLG